MEEAKAAAYYDELTRKGEGAARFKQGLGFSTTSATDSGSAVPSRGSALPSSASFLNNFVRASSPTKPSEIQKHAQIEAIQNKLKKKPTPSENQTSKVPNDRRRDDAETNVGRERRRRRSSSRERDRHSKRRTRSRSRSRSRDDILIGSRRSNRSSSRDRDKDRDRNRDRFRARDVERRRRRRSRSRSASDDDRARRRGRGKSRSRSSSPRDKRPENSNRGDGSRHKGAGKVGKERNGGIDYSRLIEGYDTMSPAERVKAKMKLQLSETAEKDETKGMGSGWERFEFNKDAPLDDEEAEAAEDDAVLVKHIGQSFRFSAVEARREEDLKAAHDNAMFGASSIPSSINADDEVEGDSNENAPTTSLISGDSNDIAPTTSLISDKVLAMQQGSWRNRARR